MRDAKPPGGGARSALDGQEREDSSLFSLRDLAKQGAPPATDAVAPNRDDSGLIDLAALAAMDAARAERPKLDVAPFVGVALFDVPEKAPELVPPPPEQARARAPAWRTIALLAGAVMVVAAASAIAVAATRGAGEGRLPPVAALHTATVPASPPPEEPRQTEAPARTEVEPAHAAATTKPGPAQAPSRRVPRPPGSAVVKPSKPAPACDLMCQMQKSVGRSR